MKSPKAIRESQLPHNLLLGLIGLTFMLVWLPLWRCIMDGSTYQWGMSYFGYNFHSKGISADLWVLLIQLPFFALLAYSFYWIKNRNLFYSLLGLWFVFSFGNLFYVILLEGGIEFQGDTMGVKTSVTGLVLALGGICLALIGWAIWKDRQSEDMRIPWTGRNKKWMVALLALLPLQLLLFATGEPHGTTDEIGVVLTIAQAILLPFIFVPGRGLKRA
ncbi:MAG: ubiquinol cytochrome C oxidoreductase [Phaeodactylibacter sp.]|nr:ubiquinol cytochrome C oxidoreductase [Phaeodactylibacter sp.]MCB9264825.1 ubiquinol cytochrome C oxidoreductase [Lewinellaceae bacterium]MCB9286387.1 ubiquinol cytochrome C oxidoreductase [Lewinellaceae bacterium]